MKSLQLPVPRLAATLLPACSRVTTPNHPQFIVCRRSEWMFPHSPPIIISLPTSVSSVFSCFSTVSLTTGLDLLGCASYYSPSSVLSTPATVDSATLRSCPPCRRRMSSLTYTHPIVRLVRPVIYYVNYLYREYISSTVTSRRNCLI